MDEKQLFNKDSEFIAVNKKSFEKLIGLVEELVINKIRIEKLKNEMQNNAYAKVLEQEIGISSHIQHTMKKMLMVKMENIYTIINELVDLYCKESQVAVELIMEGESTEVESSIVNNIIDTFRYFIKDMFDNDFNLDKNKSYQIKIQSFSSSKDITIYVENDNTNFNWENLYKVFNKQHIELTSLNESEIYRFSNMIDSKGNVDSLLKVITEVESLGGSILLEAEKDKFKRLKVNIPVASTMIQALLVDVSDNIYAIPLEDVETITNRNALTIKHSNGIDFILYMGHAIRLISVADALNIESENSGSCILIIKTKNGLIALLVDSLIDQTDIVIRQKPAIIKKIKEFKGATILGDGLVTLVLDVSSFTENI